MVEHKFIKNQLQIYNRIIGIINNKVLLSLDIKLPEIQRIIDHDNVEEIVNYQINYYKDHKKFNFLGVLNIHYVIENQKYYLIDGQHRYKAIQNLYNIGHCEIDVAIELVEVNTLEELKENYKIINKNTQLPAFSEEIDKNIPESIAIYFKNKYPSMWSKTSRAHRPNIFFSFFQEGLGILTEKLKINNEEYLKEILENYNSKLSKWPITSFPENSTITTKIINKCKQSGLYLGLFKYSHDDIGYKWVKKIIEEETGIIIKKEIKGKKKIPKKIKDDSWDKYIGKKYGTAYCICCNKKEIQQKNFVGGHIISEKNGGNIIIENIIPICNDCNLSMGTKNMNDFIQEHYPENYSNFINRNTGSSYKIDETSEWSLSNLIF